MIEAVIFDMDGLMVDTEILCYKMYKSFLKTKGIEINKNDYASCFTGKKMDDGLYYAKKYFNIEFEVDEAIHYFISNEDTSQNVDLKPGLEELVHYLHSKNIKMAMATSSGLERVHKLLDPYDILKYFDTITCGSEVKHGKPAPDIFLKACEKLAVEPTHALVLEDSETGIQAAYSANIPVICIPDLKNPAEKYEKMTTAILKSLHDVIDFVEKDS